MVTTRRGFTLIELMVVVAIVLALIGMIIAAITLMRGRAQITRTRTIIAIVHTAISQNSISANTLSPVEHPLAASAPTRRIFLRASGGTPVAVAGDAIRATDMAFVPGGDQPRVLLDSDLFADPVAPQFIGMPRWRMAVLGATTKWVSSWLRISGAGQAGRRIEPDLGTWVDEGFLRQAVTDSASTAWEEAADKAMGVALGGTADELLALGAYWRPDTTRDPLIHANRLRQDLSAKASPGSTTWFPGSILEGAQYVPYRLRGPAVVDAWGREILASITPTGALRLESAGPDGVFRFHPGRDMVLQSTAAGLAGDDRDGESDNVFVGPKE